jgi:hypothetical protein
MTRASTFCGRRNVDADGLDKPGHDGFFTAA